MFSCTPDGNIDEVRQVLTLLLDASVTFTLKKCEFFTDRINYLGHVILPGCLEVLSHTTDATRDLQLSKNVTETRSFLGFCNVFRHLVPYFEQITRLPKKAP